MNEESSTATRSLYAYAVALAVYFGNNSTPLNFDRPTVGNAKMLSVDLLVLSAKFILHGLILHSSFVVVKRIQTALGSLVGGLGDREDELHEKNKNNNNNNKNNNNQKNQNQFQYIEIEIMIVRPFR